MSRFQGAHPFLDLAQGTERQFAVTTMERGIRYRANGRSLRSRWSLALALGAGLALTFSRPAQAATETLDQFQNGTSGVERVGQMAQTFTAGMTGQLDRISLATDASPATFSSNRCPVRSRPVPLS